MGILITRKMSDLLNDLRHQNVNQQKYDKCQERIMGCFPELDVLRTLHIALLSLLNDICGHFCSIYKYWPFVSVSINGMHRPSIRRTKTLPLAYGQNDLLPFKIISIGKAICIRRICVPGLHNIGHIELLSY